MRMGSPTLSQAPANQPRYGVFATPALANNTLIKHNADNRPELRRGKDEVLDCVRHKRRRFLQQLRAT